ncbi:hypothetical protein TCT1_19090 [Xenorhabdus sp. TCT-1]|uniref:Uncharacterized protein n=1 Tax=Xenorhabdus taiwanensis TaxID=3085177 RepID=A0ABN7C3Q1_9GAMM|nr:hypothetical protein TCT1_19090 [Xenorhabdus sp. TCT-1]
MYLAGWCDFAHYPVFLLIICLKNSSVDFNFIFLWLMKRHNKPIIYIEKMGRKENVSIFKTEFPRARHMVIDGVDRAYPGSDSTLFSTCDAVTALRNVHL